VTLCFIPLGCQCLISVDLPSEDKHNSGLVKSLTKICSSVRLKVFQTRSRFVFPNVISCLSSRIHLLSYRTVSSCTQRPRLILETSHSLTQKRFSATKTWLFAFVRPCRSSHGYPVACIGAPGSVTGKTKVKLSPQQAVEAYRVVRC
jgi:hypothetical protein